MEYESLKNAILKVLQVYVKEITLESTFDSDLGADSLDLVQILRIVESDLNIKLSGVNVGKIVTVGDALKAIEEQIGK